jgi:hypothetical protein
VGKNDQKKEKYVMRLENLIQKKYGYDAIKNPESGWDEDKEKKYLQKLKEFSAKFDKNSSYKDKVEVDGVLVSKKLLTRESNRTCPVCKIYSFKVQDDIYMTKYSCCFKCYVQYVEDREERWLTGWRPDNETN